MCRWLAYSGDSLYLEELLLRPKHSLISQSLAARSSLTPTNADGFGIGWYGEEATPGVYKDIRPAWNDQNLLNLAGHIRSRLFVAHVRAATEGAVQRTNCHPFRHDEWLFVHNGGVSEFARVKRDLLLGIAPELFANIHGSTDSEILFYLALTFGLRDDARLAVERMVGFVEQTGRRHAVDNPIDMTLGISDGRRLYGFRYSSAHRTPSLYLSNDISALREMRPDFARFSADARAIVSEPLTDLTGAWEEIEESSVVVLEGPEVTKHAFRPRAPD